MIESVIITFPNNRSALLTRFLVAPGLLLLLSLPLPVHLCPVRDYPRQQSLQESNVRCPTSQPRLQVMSWMGYGVVSARDHKKIRQVLMSSVMGIVIVKMCLVLLLLVLLEIVPAAAAAAFAAANFRLSGVSN